ncbi:MAG: DJ-1/PfpI family protein [Acidobacteria bacterium]|nr:DJ-1/PfpI family protein [Acidobacteriota bacterium]
MKFFPTLFLLFFVVSGIFAQTEKAVIVLKGLDAVDLVEGKEVKGKEGISVTRGRFKYLFSNRANKQKFERNPELYEVQKNGECTFMPGVPGDPELWQVYQGKIYLFGTPMCRERFQLSPETILHPEKRPKIKVRNVAIVLYEGVELLDFAGPGEVFSAAQTVDGQDGFNVYTVAETTAPIVSQGFVTIKPQYSFETAPKADIVVFPGGDVANFLDNKTAMSWAKAVSGDAEIAMSVCTGAFVLAGADLLDKKKINTHWASIRKLRRQVPTATVLENVRFVDNGQIITTAGISAGIDGALHVVERLLGTEAARLTAKSMEYDRQPVRKLRRNKN